MAPVLRREPQQQAHLTQAAAFVARLQVGCTFISKKKQRKTKHLVVLPCFAFSSIPFRIAVGKIVVQTKIFLPPPTIEIGILLVEGALGKKNLASGFNIWCKNIASDSQSSAVLLISNYGSKCTANREIPLLTDPGESHMCSFATTQKCFFPLKSLLVLPI